MRGKKKDSSIPTPEIEAAFEGQSRQRVEEEEPQGSRSIKTELRTSTAPKEKVK